MNDLERLKEELREEILAEIRNDISTRKNVDSLEKVKAKYFYGPNKKDRYIGSKMYTLFGSSGQHRVWDAVRTLTRIIFNKKSQAQLATVDQDEVERVCDLLCELVCNLKTEMIKEENQ